MSDPASRPEREPALLERALMFQGDAVRVLLSAERQELLLQWDSDASRRVLPETLHLAQQASSARTIYEAWTNAVRAMLSITPGDVAAQLLTAPELEELPLDDAPAEDHGASPEFDLDLEDPGDLDWRSAAETWAPALRLTLRERAHSFAQTLALRYDWAEGIGVLTDALDRPHWGKMHVRIEDLIRQGMTPAEFDLAHQLRSLFQEQPELNVTPCRTLHRTVYASPALRWSTALDLARAFPGHDAELLLTRMIAVCQRLAPEHRYSCWSDRLSLLLDGFPASVDGDYWLTVLEER